ncbi:MAG: GNAT family N-acetyltransferase [Candidatus Aenigmatarchaeota archaeon]
MELEIHHDPVGQKFYVELENMEAVLAYTQINKIWDVHQVIVPDKFSGQGIAEKLVLHVFNKARAKGYTIIPSCPYIKDKFLKDHPEFDDVVEKKLKF